LNHTESESLKGSNSFEQVLTLEQCSKVPGNSSPQIKNRVASFFATFDRLGGGGLFAESVGERLKLTEVSVNKKVEDSAKTEGRVVCEIEVSRDMLNWGFTVHGGCIAYLVDLCTSLSAITIDEREGDPIRFSISQALNILYHGPAHLGDVLRLVSTTVANGRRVQTIQCEVWNTTQHRLAASGVHVKMAPSDPKL